MLEKAIRMATAALHDVVEDTGLTLKHVDNG